MIWPVQNNYSNSVWPDEDSQLRLTDFQGPRQMITEAVRLSYYLWLVSFEQGGHRRPCHEQLHLSEEWPILVFFMSGSVVSIREAELLLPAITSVPDLYYG